MLTYQDFLKVKDSSDNEKMMFTMSVINSHKNSELYKDAYIADQYNRHKNVTITEYQKLLYTVTGKAIPDNISANFKMACRHFHRFIVQENQFLLGNGVTWEKGDTKNRLGTKRVTFDSQLQKAGLCALWGGVAFGFWNLDHLTVFNALEFAPLYDEETGALRAGVRFWQIDKTKPLRATLYEEDGYTEYIWKDGDAEVMSPKRKYTLNINVSETDGEEIVDGENYQSFPIVPLWGNQEHQSELVGLREQIDCYDLIKSGFANTVDESSLIYWTIKNAGGMDDVDLAKFLERIKVLHATILDDDATAESHQVEAPYASREALLERLDTDLYRDAMALDTRVISGGAVTATQIEASYEQLNSKVDGFEYCVLDFVNHILDLAGIEDNATFSRSMIINRSENIQIILQSAPFLDDEYVTRKILAILGDSDQTEEILNRMNEQEMDQFVGVDNGGLWTEAVEQEAEGTGE